MFTTFGIMNVVIGMVTEQAMTMSHFHAGLELEEQRRARMRTPETGYKKISCYS